MAARAHLKEELYLHPISQIIPTILEERHAAALAMQHVHRQAPRTNRSIAGRAHARTLRANDSTARAYNVVKAVVWRGSHEWPVHRHHRHRSREHCLQTLLATVSAAESQSFKFAGVTKRPGGGDHHDSGKPCTQRWEGERQARSWCNRSCLLLKATDQ